MRAGDLRHRIIIQQNTPTRDTYGAEVESWGTFDTLWAAVEPITGQERFTEEGAQLLAQADHRIRIRHRSGITHKMRVSFDSRIFDIEAVLNVGYRDREIYLLCKENPSA